MDTFLVILTMIMRIICLAILVCDAWAMKGVVYWGFMTILIAITLI